MPVLPIEERSVELAADTLRSGAPVVIPAPFAIGQPGDIDVGEIVIRPTAQA